MRTGKIAVAALLCAFNAAAQTSTDNPGIDVQLFKPAPGVSDVLTVQGSKTADPLKYQVGLYANYARNPLLVVNPATGAPIGALIANQFGFDLYGSMGLAKNLELGLLVPLSLQSSDLTSAGSVPLQPVQGFALGDVRLLPKYHLFDTHGVGLAVSAPLVLPTGSKDAYVGSGAFGAQPRIDVDYTLPNDFRFLANLGINLRPVHKQLNLTYATEFAWSAATEIPVRIENRDLAVQAAIGGAAGLAGGGANGVPVELLVAGRYRFNPHVALTVGAGRGITSGYGTPDYRILAGLAWRDVNTEQPAVVTPVVEAVKPRCAPEDVDGFQDEDGCADPDNDQDGIADAADLCPNDPETKNGYHDEDGCPDETPARLAPLPKPDPTADTDQDGIPDVQDLCANAAEDKDGFEDQDGCPDPDNDRDGVADATDQCPLEAETINGVSDEDGCPDKGKSKFVVKGEKIVILDKVYFATDKDVILPKSFNVLSQVGSVLKANPQIHHLRVEGHTDDKGDDKHNMDLSQRRADSVKKYLISVGIEAERLESIGYGETRPVDSNKTAKGRENNRRVEFTIVQDEPKPDEEVAP